MLIFKGPWSSQDSELRDSLALQSLSVKGFNHLFRFMNAVSFQEIPASLSLKHGQEDWPAAVQCSLELCCLQLLIFLSLPLTSPPRGAHWELELQKLFIPDNLECANLDTASKAKRLYLNGLLFTLSNRLHMGAPVSQTKQCLERNNHVYCP
jgi:hypothetical protein